MALEETDGLGSLSSGHYSVMDYGVWYDEMPLCVPIVPVRIRARGDFQERNAKGKNLILDAKSTNCIK